MDVSVSPMMSRLLVEVSSVVVNPATSIKILISLCYVVNALYIDIVAGIRSDAIH